MNILNQEFLRNFLKILLLLFLGEKLPYFEVDSFKLLYFEVDSFKLLYFEVDSFKLLYFEVDSFKLLYFEVDSFIEKFIRKFTSANLQSKLWKNV